MITLETTSEKISAGLAVRQRSQCSDHELCHIRVGPPFSKTSFGARSSAAGATKGNTPVWQSAGNTPPTSTDG